MNYYIADPHFGHANIIRFDGRPFANTQEMENILIHNWNGRVTNDDVVYMIGDFCWGLEKDWIRILDKLNGSKVLIRGNHDLDNPSRELKKRIRKICDREEVKDNGRRIILDHYPILFYRGSYNKDIWMFCGHTHNRTNEEMKRREFVQNLIDSRKEDFDNKGHIINVGCMMEYVNYTPRTADELIAWWYEYYGE
jgi:calcineurin-like phosphoesterase family protein